MAVAYLSNFAVEPFFLTLLAPLRETNALCENSASRVLRGEKKFYPSFFSVLSKKKVPVGIKAAKKAMASH